MHAKLAGKRTYLVAATMAAYAIAGGLLGEFNANAAFRLLLEAAGLVGLRMGVASVKGEES